MLRRQKNTEAASVTLPAISSTYTIKAEISTSKPEVALLMA
jgi:hypothetical protein